MLFVISKCHDFHFGHYVTHFSEYLLMFNIYCNKLSWKCYNVSQKMKKLCQFNFEFEFGRMVVFIKPVPREATVFFYILLHIISLSNQFCTIIAPFFGTKFDTFQTIIGSYKIEWDFCLLQTLWVFILLFLSLRWQCTMGMSGWYYQQYKLYQPWQASLVSQLD